MNRETPTLAEKIDLIRHTFANQYAHLGGWSKRESLQYLKSLGIEVNSANDLTEAQADVVLEDLRNSRMV